MYLNYDYDPEQHVVPFGLECTGWLQRHFKNPNLFVHYNRMTGRWVLSEWMEGRRWQSMEDVILLNSGPVPVMTREIIHRLEFLFWGPSMDPCKTLTQYNRNVLKQLQVDSDEEDEVYKYCSQRTGTAGNPFDWTAGG